jgi:PAS domain S-box-containing protein
VSAAQNELHDRTSMPELDEQLGSPKDLQRFINDLVSVLALPAWWSDGEPLRIVNLLADVVLQMLDLNFVYLSLSESALGKPVEIVRVASWWTTKLDLHEACLELKRSLRQKNWPSVIRKAIGKEEIFIVPISLGLEGEVGFVAAGSQRAGFPEQTERLLLGVTANQALIGLQQAQLLAEQRKMTADLDRRVAQRTKELADANEELQLQAGLLQRLPVSTWTLKPDGTPDFVNQIWLDYSGQTLDFVRSHPEAWMTAVHPEDREAASKAFRDGIRSELGFAIETRSLRARDRTYRWHLQQAVVLRDADGKLLKFVGTTTDIDDQKRAEEKVRRSEAVLAESQRLSVTGSFTWCVATGEITWSKQLYRIFEFELVVPVTLALICSRVHPDDLASFREQVERSCQDRSDVERELRLQMPDRSIKYLHIVAHNRGDSDQPEYIGAVQDVTQRRLAEGALTKARTEFAHVVRSTSLGEMTASIAHEVNQPLSGIITNAGTCLRMLNTDPPNLDGARETAKRTMRDGNRAAEVIARLRTLYSKKAPSLELMDLNEAAREVTALLLSELQTNGVILQHEFADGLPKVQGDRIQLQQVILNLVRNASDAMRDVESRPRHLLIRTEQACETVRVTIQDSGIGFDPAIADRLFESFYTTKADGMGMGLSVSRSIIEAHGGRLRATANDGPGATFSFSLPCEATSKL